MKSLAIRKLADTSEGQRVRGFDPLTGAPTLINPETSAVEPWPLAGVRIEGEPPAECTVPTSFVASGVREGWIELVGERVVHRPGGPPDDLWRLTHTFMHADAVVLKCVDGDVRYRVTRQPDKYVVDDDAAAVTPEIYAAGATSVAWFFELELEA